MGTLEFTSHVLDKRYELSYSIDNKGRTLISVTSLLLGVSALIYREIDGLLEHLMLMASISLSTASVLMSTYFLLPKIRSGVGREESLRTLRGTLAFTTANEYVEALGDAREEDLIFANADQILKLDAICERQTRRLRHALACTSASSISLLGLLAVVFFST